MKTQPINNQSFKALYVSQNPVPYTEKQQEIIKDIQNKFTRNDMVKVKEKGYDLFLEQGLTDFDNKISVYAVKNLDCSDGYYVRSIRKLPIGDYEMNFDPLYVHYQIDKFEKNEIKQNNFAKIMIGALFATALAICAAWAIKTAKSPKTPAVQKATTELIHTPLKVK